MTRRTRYRILAGACTSALFANSAQAAEIWKSTFDTGPDGVVDIRDNNALKPMIGPVTNGALQITTMDAGSYPYTPDKAGRPLGTTVTSTDSFSGLYQFNWSQVDQTESPQTWELVGFLGGNTVPQTRQVLGSILRHWRVSGTDDYYVGVDLAYGSVGFSNFGYSAGPPTFLGTNPEGKPFQLAIGYDGTTKILSVGLFDAAGEPLIERAGTLASIIPDTPTNETNEINAMSLTHLGWEDYSAYLTDQTTTWQNDALTYFDTFDGARNAVVNMLGKAWGVNADGNWLDDANWTPAGAPNAPGAAATFGSVIDAPRTITVSGASPVVGNITFNSDHKYTISGTGFLTLNRPAGATITVANGSHEIAVPLTFTSGTNLTVEVTDAADTLRHSSDLGAAGGSVTKTGAGTFELLHARAGAFNVNGGVVRVLPSGGVAAGAGRVDTLTIAAGAKLDLTDNKLITTSTPVGTATTVVGNTRLYDGLQGMVQSAKNGDAWDGSGLTSSLAATTGGLTTIGIANGAQAKGGIGATETAVWGGQTVTGSDILAMYTYAGDANLDGAITGDDYSAIDFGILFPGMDGYANGDFNYDGFVTGDDYSVIDLNILLQGPQFPTGGSPSELAGVAAVPEPSGMAFAATGALMLAAGRRRRLLRSSSPG